MSTTTAASSVNGASAGNSANSSFASSAGGGKPQLKMTAMEGTRKQAGSPTDQAQRKAPPQAWKGPNPITQRPSNPTTANGVAAPVKQPAPAKMAPPAKKESNTGDKHANDRLTFLLANLMGLQATVTLHNGERYSGIFAGGSPDPPEPRYVLKMVKRLESLGQQQSNGVAELSDEYIGQGEDHVMAFDCQDIVDLNVPNVSMDRTRTRGQNGVYSQTLKRLICELTSKGVSNAFRTDADISGNAAARERNLQKWEPSADTSVDLSLESSGASGWDQFETNRRLYGVESNYDEEIYTTKIDKSHPLYAQRAANAERLAREIEGGTAANAHVAEERGLKPVDDSGLDEEDKYSGVRREYEPLPTGNPNKYTPPARRPPTGQPTVPGQPYDPAIIQASIAKPASPSVPTETADSKKAEVAAEKSTQASAPKAAETTAAGKTSSADQLKAGAFRNDRKASDSGKKSNPENASETVEKDLMDAFKQFATTEKARVHNQQRQRMNQDKQMKINDLKKFAQNFKLNTPVPNDLVPILAKDEKKQQEIRDKAKVAAAESKMTPPKPAAAPGPVVDQKGPRPGVANQQTPISPQDRNQPRRQGPPQYPPYPRGGDPRAQGQNMPPRQPLSTRLSYNQQQLRAGIPPQNIPGPAPIQIPQQGPPGSNSGMQSPSSSISTRFNVGAREFKPNPAAHTFSPSVNQSNTSSPGRHDSTRPASKGISDFFEGRSPLPADQHPSLDGAFNPIDRMMKEVAADEKLSKDYFVNGGIPNAFKTQPVWEVPETNQDLTYAQALENGSRGIPPITSPPHSIMQSGPIPHQHQLPLHLQQNGPMIQQGHTPHQTPRNMPVQPHPGQPGPHHFDDHRMQYSQSQSSVHPSPRAMPQFMAVNNGQPVTVYQQPMPHYGLSPSGHAVAIRQIPPGATFVNPQGPMMGGHMMSQQASTGGYVLQPGMQIYQGSPAPGHVYPHQHPGGPGGPMQGPTGVPTAPNGYPSPRPPAPMMQHQGSQQGHGVPQGPGGQQMMYMQQPMHGPAMFAGAPSGPMAQMRGPFPQQPHGQPHYGTSPHHHQQYPGGPGGPGPQRGTPSAQYAQPMMPQHSMGGMPQQQGGPPPPQPQQMPAAAQIDTGASGEEVK
ncbi:hypothetical protein NA57DRAFT_74543 [Rhizodiscina lignyota]|uniref:LsmAD domain-containing protein n=1 Tax=Rhizodiscina lignyota TaxID=1504668 RepID=A0A9P4M7Q4_9PEZI|nr:hypothetical protein NA57DRAFT_74543 [Rhizodiscina lignyota]